MLVGTFFRRKYFYRIQFSNWGHFCCLWIKILFIHFKNKFSSTSTRPSLRGTHPDRCRSFLWLCLTQATVSCVKRPHFDRKMQLFFIAKKRVNLAFIQSLRLKRYSHFVFSWTLHLINSAAHVDYFQFYKNSKPSVLIHGPQPHRIRLRIKAISAVSARARPIWEALHAQIVAIHNLLCKWRSLVQNHFATVRILVGQFCIIRHTSVTCTSCPNNSQKVKWKSTKSLPAELIGIVKVSWLLLVLRFPTVNSPLRRG